MVVPTLKALITVAADDILIFLIIMFVIKLVISHESSADPVKCQILFLK